MTMWQCSAPSNQTTPTHQHNSQVEDSPSNLPELLVEETLESQAEYPREMVEEVEEAEEVEVAEEEEAVFPLQPQHNKELPMGETNSSVIHRLYSQEIEGNQRHL